tara:strand:- start:5017 stop:5145 length:129 start_codon:yes stop_codon:yes gene_type:complete
LEPDDDVVDEEARPRPYYYNVGEVDPDDCAFPKSQLKMPPYF